MQETFAMKEMIIISLSLSWLLVGTSLLSAQQQLSSDATTNAEPRIQFQQPLYDFGKAKSGEVVKYSFIFTNIGDAPLVLASVQPQCGCTAAGEWTRTVEPGKTGSIPIQFNTANYEGPVLKTITVGSNDKLQPSVGLQLKGTVWRPVDVQPRFALLTVAPGTASNVTMTVHIVNKMEELITLSPPESDNSRFTAALETNIVGRDFRVIVSAVPPFLEPTARGQITLRTSSTNSPLISFPVWLNLQQAMAQLPKPRLGAPPAVTP